MEEQRIDACIAIWLKDGAISRVEPESAYTKWRKAGSTFTTIGDYLNKMMEYHYRVIPGMCIPAGDYQIILMQRGE